MGAPGERLPLIGARGRPRLAAAPNRYATSPNPATEK